MNKNKLICDMTQAEIIEYYENKLQYKDKVIEELAKNCCLGYADLKPDRTPDFYIKCAKARVDERG